ncbi:MAG: hypothetical protein K6F99_04930 [Lachnospiraceae bacterium]|nr:hypothetical protein [Lachnospiraceae bacterium]
MIIIYGKIKTSPSDERPGGSFEKKYKPKKGLKLSRKNIAENICESTATYNIPLYLGWNIDHYS